MQDHGKITTDVHKSKRQAAIAIVSTLIVVTMIVAVIVGISSSYEPDHPVYNTGEDGDDSEGTSIKAITALCHPTEYKKTCEESLAEVAEKTTNPKDILRVSFNITVDEILKAVNHSHTLHDVAKDKGVKDALRICGDLMENSLDDLKRAMQVTQHGDLSNAGKLVAELKVWLGGALTYQGTCLDGFENTTGKAGEEMREALKTSIELTRNGLAIIDQAMNQTAAFHIPKLQRRLLSSGAKYHKDGFPTWVSPAKRALLSAKIEDIKPNLVVAKDGSGKYKTINDALKEVPKKNVHPFVIHVKEGVYDEIVKVRQTNVVIIGDGPLKTKITGKRSFIDGYKTIETATFTAGAHGFIAKDIGFENSAGPEKHQAVALRVHSDLSVIYNCRIDGHQDTLYVHTHRQFYRDCIITGTIDFIFGNAQAVFQNCELIVRKPLDNQYNVVTAQGRDDKYDAGAIVLQGCTISADPLYLPVSHQMKTYLGRPWKTHSRTIIMKTQIDEFVQPEGWTQWPAPNQKNHLTCFYAEYENKGMGENLSGRVKWPCVHTLSQVDAQQFTPGVFFNGDDWIRQAGVPYYPGITGQ